MSDLRVALIQTDIFWEDKGANLAMLEEKVWSIQKDVDLILLPEVFNAGFSSQIHKLAEVPGLQTQRWLLQIASQKNAMVCGSYLVRDGQNIHNRFVAAFPDGSLQFYDKRHLFNLAEIERKLTPGSSRKIINYKGWRISPMICYDLRFPSWSANFTRADGSYDIDFLIYVANWPEQRIDAWDALLKARAIENQCYVAGANRTGTDGNGLKYVGHSQIIDFTGQSQTYLENDEGILMTTLLKSKMSEFRSKLPFVADAGPH